MAAMKKDDGKEKQDDFVLLVAGYMNQEFNISEKVRFPIEIFDIIGAYSKLDEKVEGRLENAFKNGLKKMGLSQLFDAFKKDKPATMSWGTYMRSDQYRETLAKLTKK